MGETGQKAGWCGGPRRDQVDAICDFIRRTFEEASEAVGPPETARQHFREARIEFLRGVRAMVDHRIDRLSHQGRKGPNGSRVVVE